MYVGSADLKCTIKSFSSIDLDVFLPVNRAAPLLIKRELMRTFPRQVIGKHITRWQNPTLVIIHVSPSTQLSVGIVASVRLRRADPAPETEDGVHQAITTAWGHAALLRLRVGPLINQGGQNVEFRRHGQ